MGAMASIPFSPPSALTEARVLQIAAGLLGAALANPVILSIPRAAHEMHRVPGAAGIACLTTAIFSVFLASWALRVKRLGEVVALTVGVGMLCGVLNLAWIFAIVSGIAERSVTGMFSAFLIALLMGAFVGGAVGFLVGGFYAPLFAYVSSLAKKPSHEGKDVALAVSGLWMLFAAAGMTLLDRPTRRAAGPLEWLTQREIAGPVLVTLGLSLILLGVARVVGRRRWLREVSAGNVADWFLDNTAAAGLTAQTSRGAEKLLCRGGQSLLLVAAQESADIYRGSARVPTTVASV